MSTLNKVTSTSVAKNEDKRHLLFKAQGRVYIRNFFTNPVTLCPAEPHFLEVNGRAKATLLQAVFFKEREARCMLGVYTYREAAPCYETLFLKTIRKRCYLAPLSYRFSSE